MKPGIGEWAKLLKTFLVAYINLFLLLLNVLWRALDFVSSIILLMNLILKIIACLSYDK